MTGLNPDNNEPAYLLGRLWAELEHLDIEATGAHLSQVNNRHHATAISEPTLVIRWLGQYSPKLIAKLRAKRPAAADRYVASFDELVGRLPATIQPMKGDTAAQSLFTVGYHHQRGRTAGRNVTAAEIADQFGYGSAAAARAELSRLGLTDRGRDPQTGAKLWSLTDFEERHAAKPGRGSRTDLKEPEMRTWTLEADVPVGTLQVMVQEYFPGQVAPSVSGGRYATVSAMGTAVAPPAWMTLMKADYPGRIVSID